MSSKAEDYYKSYEGKTLLAKHSMSDVGIWHIKGEDPNCDMGGSHHQPSLGFVEGKLEDVIHYAVTLKGFWVWGAGGSITKINIIKVNQATTTKRIVAENQIRKMKDTLLTLEE